MKKDAGFLEFRQTISVFRTEPAIRPAKLDLYELGDASFLSTGILIGGIIWSATASTRDSSCGVNELIGWLRREHAIQRFPDAATTEEI